MTRSHTRIGLGWIGKGLILLVGLATFAGLTGCTGLLTNALLGGLTSSYLGSLGSSGWGF